MREGELVWSSSTLEGRALDEYLLAAHRRRHSSQLRFTWEETALATLQEQGGDALLALDVLALEEDIAASALWTAAELEQLFTAERAHGTDIRALHASLCTKRSLAETVSAVHLHCAHQAREDDREDVDGYHLVSAKKRPRPRPARRSKLSHKFTGRLHITLADMIEFGAIEPGQAVLEHRCNDVLYNADLLPDGKISFTLSPGAESQKFCSLSHFVRHLRRINGLRPEFCRGWNYTSYKGLPLVQIKAAAFSDFSVHIPELPVRERPMSSGPKTLRPKTSKSKSEGRKGVKHTPSRDIFGMSQYYGREQKPSLDRGQAATALSQNNSSESGGARGMRWTSSESRVCIDLPTVPEECHSLQGLAAENMIRLRQLHAEQPFPSLVLEAEEVMCSCATSNCSLFPMLRDGLLMPGKGFLSVLCKNGQLLLADLEESGHITVRELSALSITLPAPCCFLHLMGRLGLLENKASIDAIKYKGVALNVVPHQEC
uniref:ELM2 domain-containing protein n=1 Tax=Coccolithus braarudii TaxID=221442 RepID=A0A7S0QB92_9EUKA